MRVFDIEKYMNMHRPDWTHFRSFLQVAHSGSLSAAARELGLTQPTLARHIEQLEASLGMRLFTRSPQGLAPTPAGERLVPYAETMNLAADALVRTARGKDEEIAGVVRLSASEIIGAEVLPPILRDIRAAFPRIVFELVLSNATADVLRREVDIAVRNIEPTQQALLARKIGDVELGFYAHKDYLAQRGEPKNTEEVLAHDLIGFDLDQRSTRAVNLDGVEVTRELFTYRMDNQLGQLAALRAGCGIGVCQVPLAARTDGLERIISNVTVFDLPIWVVMHEDVKDDPRMRIVFNRLGAGLEAYLAETR